MREVFLFGTGIYGSKGNRCGRKKRHARCRDGKQAPAGI
jgi:hypothetical protein